MPLYARKCLKIINKQAKLQPFELNEGQRELDAELVKQRESGKPKRALVLKARQVGFSTYVQGLLIRGTTLNENQNAAVVSHDTKTGDKLFAMGQTMYGHLPDGVKPPIRSHRRGRFLHFAPPGKNDWASGNTYPNSTYFVDTAGEFEAGRGGTFQLAHLSEFAFWEQPEKKLVAMQNAVPRENLDTVLIIESTANGMNLFRDLWEDAEQGRSDFIPFFWPWWKEPTYSLPFANEAEKVLFKNQVGVGPYGEDEGALLRMLKEDHSMDEVYRKLHWRRSTIANECAGRVSVFHQEYPSTPEEAFISSGSTVFDTELVKGILLDCDITDPRVPNEKHPGPMLGSYRGDPKSEKTMRGRVGELKVAQRAMWVPKSAAGQRDLVRVWKDPDDESQFVIGVDVSGGEMSDGATQAAFHAVQVIDHQTREQVAEYRSHIDADVLAQLVYHQALFYNNAWVAVEITGGWGLPVINRIYKDYHYPYIYIRHAHQSTHERQTKEIGWHTTQRTKPMIETNAVEMVREGSHGIRSRELANEMLSYMKDERGRTAPAPGRFSDLLIAWMIAQQVANELPIRTRSKESAAYRPINPVTGY
jgi:hypothetical protein